MNTTTPGAGSSGRILAGIIVVVIVVALATTLFIYTNQPNSETTTSVSSSSTTSSLSVTTSSSSSFTSALSSNSSSSSSISVSQSSTTSTGPTSASCSTSVQSSPFAFTLQATSQSPAQVCVTVYYYNLTSSITLNPIDQISILGMQTYSNGTTATFNAKSNFTITSQTPSISIGGPSSQNEGATISYSISPNPGTNGKFALNFGWLLPGKTQCNEEFVLVAGTGAPNFTYPGQCSNLTGGSTSTPYPSGYVFVQIQSVTNSTE